MFQELIFAAFGKEIEMEKTYNITVNRDQLATLMTAIHMELDRDYNDEIKSDLLDVLMAVMAFEVQKF